MHWIIARGGILGDNNAVTLRVSIKGSRAHTRVQVHASDDQRIRIELVQNRIKLSCGKGTEKYFMDDRFFLVRTKHIGTSVARRTLKAHPVAVLFSMRHAVISGLTDRAPNMDDWDCARAACIQQIGCGSGNAGGVRL